MPLYEYQCESCGHRFEVIQKLSDAPIAVCPSCGGPVHKLQSAPAFQFKGSGWYITDYARKDQKESAKSGGGSPDDSKSSSGKADKPAETPAKSSDSSPASTNSSAAPSTKPST